MMLFIISTILAGRASKGLKIGTATANNWAWKHERHAQAQGDMRGEVTLSGMGSGSQGEKLDQSDGRPSKEEAGRGSFLLLRGTCKRKAPFPFSRACDRR